MCEERIWSRLVSQRGQHSQFLALPARSQNRGGCAKMATSSQFDQTAWTHSIHVRLLLCTAFSLASVHKCVVLPIINGCWSYAHPVQFPPKAHPLGVWLGGVGFFFKFWNLLVMSMWLLESCVLFGWAGSFLPFRSRWCFG